MCQVGFQSPLGLGDASVAAVVERPQFGDHFPVTLDHIPNPDHAGDDDAFAVGHF